MTCPERILLIEDDDSLSYHEAAGCKLYLAELGYSTTRLTENAKYGTFVRSQLRSTVVAEVFRYISQWAGAVCLEVPGIAFLVNRMSTYEVHRDSEVFPPT